MKRYKDKRTYEERKDYWKDRDRKKYVLGQNFTHDFERKIYDIQTFEDYDMVMKILSDHALRELLRVIADKPRTVEHISNIMIKSPIIVKMMLDDIDKLGFLLIKSEQITRYTVPTYQAKYNTFMFDLR